MPDWEDYYEILGVNPEASIEEIKRAYRDKCFIFHPDRMKEVPESAKREAEEQLKKINRANDVLKDSKKRKRYDQEWLDRKTTPPQRSRKTEPSSPPSTRPKKNYQSFPIGRISFVGLALLIIALVLAFQFWPSDIPTPILSGDAKIEWHKTFGGADNDRGYAIEQTSDGGYIISGETFSYGAGNRDVWLVKTDASGNKEWSKTFGGTALEYGIAIKQTSDGGFIITGRTQSFGAGYMDVWLIKTDASGNKEWDNTFGGSNGEGGISIQQTSDEGYIISGSTDSFSSNNYADAWLIKTDKWGNEEWNRTFGGLYGDEGRSVRQTTDGGYILAGGSATSDTETWHAFLIKTDASGNEQWSKAFAGSGYDFFNSVLQTSDAGFIISGWTTSFGAGGYDAWLVKTDASGNEEWSHTFGGPGDDYTHEVQMTSDGGYVLAGTITSYGNGGYDCWLIKTDASGNEEWSTTFGGPEDDWMREVEETSDGHFIAVGCTSSYGAGGEDLWIVKVKGT